MFDGNDNHPGLLLENETQSLTVQELITLDSFMKEEKTVSICEEELSQDYLSSFSDTEVGTLKGNSQ